MNTIAFSKRKVKIKSEVKDRLVTGLAQYLTAQSAGSSKFAVADSYLALDNYFSAILMEKGVDPTRNHKTKLDRIISNFGKLIIKGEQKKLGKFYKVWQKVRYSSAIPTPNEAVNFLRLSHQIMSKITKEIARRHGMTADELEKKCYGDVLGERWQIFEEECSYIHEAWQQEAEIQDERGYGSKLGNKIFNPSNFCTIYVLADDPITKDILIKDSNFSSDIAKFYQSFLNLVVSIQNARYKRGIKDNEIPNFMLSLRMRYHGNTIEKITNDFGKKLAKAIKKLKH